MPTLNKRENFMRMINKEMPEYIPEYNLFWAFGGPSFLWRPPAEGEPMKNMFGVEMVMDSSGLVPAPMPKTTDFVLTDITKWRDIVKIPEYDFPDSAWADEGKKAIDARNPDVPAGGGVSTGWFQPLVALMGFTEGLAACFEEPEEVKAMMQYFTDWSVEMTKKCIYYFKPDFGFIGDDIAHERNPFLSLEMFQDLIAPYWRAYYAVYLEAGIPVGMHNCGHFELYLDDLVDMGCSFWDPVQSSNDAVAIKEKFGRNLALCGGIETRFYDEDTSEEEVRAAVRAYCDALAPGGGFAMPEMALFTEGMPGISPTELKHFMWMGDEFEKIRYSYY
jgi:hypothetical protein